MSQPERQNDIVDQTKGVSALEAVEKVGFVSGKFLLC